MTEASWNIQTLPEGVKVLTLSHPSKSNALNALLVQQLGDALSTEILRGVKALLIRSEKSRSFCSGYDLTTLGPVADNAPLPDDSLTVVFDILSSLSIPSVACVTGPAFGAGCELALACDFRIAGPDASFCMPPAKLGVVYSAQGMARVAARSSWQVARWMFLSGRSLPSMRALEVGLIDERHATSVEAEEAALNLAMELAERAPLSIQGMKESLAILQKVDVTPDDARLLRERRRTAFNSADFQEGRTAFLEKRRPLFRGD